ncbi:glycyl-tRNA synthetase beta chain [Hasllibacter halocynthiae]|uniref:Glycine--tRNA ligase beta subunit n=1 Tax=Hasllibacter halocynthiae TaxID=595589 RepID=A0A2T0X6C7_9RHOB|nr:glycine--tRNA ligase subunit beta [Hasllibacter halocynthiae]PRY94489.1 glycyl-tRNA synthetase beta chain [Hasllibacter halocynthiae]
MDLLIELFSEEIPARMQRKAREDLKRMMTDGLVEAGLTYAGAEAFSTPRRLTLAVEGLTEESPTIREERRGPRVGAPEKAVEGFLRGAGVERSALREVDGKKGAFYVADVVTPGRPAAAIVAEVLEGAIRGFPWPKSMRWGTGSLRWVRPLRRILCILVREDGAEVVPLAVDGIDAGDVTEGHRFMAPAPFSVASFEDYERRLKRAKVVLSADDRAEGIWNDVAQTAFAAGLEPVEDPGLLSEVAGLVEWPVPLMGEIADQFLSLPPEVLVTSMKEHQKFFSLKDRQGRVVRFVTVANIEAPDGGEAILSGNRRVLSARLADAKFFWENDLAVARAGMKAWLDKLGAVTFHAKLGTQAERVGRIAALAREIAPFVGADPDAAELAAKLAKADLASEMVYEFPELQGTMGRYYVAEALLADPSLAPEGQHEVIANAAEAHYRPLGPSDGVPTDPVAVAVALADKIDTLTGFWTIDEKPTGSKDPYALRRAALGVIRLVMENDLRLLLGGVFVQRFEKFHLAQIYEDRAIVLPDGMADERGNWRQPWDYNSDDEDADEHTPPRRIFSPEGELLSLVRSGRVAGFAEIFDDLDGDGMDQPVKRFATPEQTTADLLSFLHDRLKVFLRDRGVRHDVIDAVLHMPNADDLALLTKRAAALQALLDTEDGTNLIQGFRRADNILRQAEDQDGVEYSFGPDPKFAEADEEKALFDALDRAEPKIDEAMAEEDFEAAMREMAALRAPIDAFFEAVQVNDDRQAIRRNRLNLLHRIRTTLLKVADLRRIEG